MFNLPKSTEVRKIITKKLIYEKFAAELGGEKKRVFDDDISKIVIINEISPVSVNIKEGEQVKSIFLVQVELKNKNYNERNLVMISKLFGQNLLMVLKYREDYQFAIFQTKLLHSEWKKEEDCELNLTGLDLDVVWQNLVSQVSGIIAQDGNTLDEQISYESEKAKLKKQIQDLEKKARNEVQAKKKFEMHQRIKTYVKKLEEM